MPWDTAVGGRFELVANIEKPIEGKKEDALRAVFDEIHFREFKILLQPESFGDLERDVRGYWKHARSVARQNSAIVSDSRDAGRTELREVVYFDTPNGDLYRHGFMLRKRALYVRGSPSSRFELALTYRGPDVLQAAAVDVRAAPQYEGTGKFKEELLRVTGPAGGMRSLYSHSCRLKEHSWELGGRFSEVIRMFPGLGDLKILPTAAVKPVGDTPVEELLFQLGNVDFGGRGAPVRMAVWRDARTKQALAVEFSFETHFRRYGKLEPQAKLRSERFYQVLQKETGSWLGLATTRTALIYALAGTMVPPAE